jgi:tryptophanyl-tRNA synthetase
LSSLSSEQRIVSGMRATGRLHLGHYHGALKNWLSLQHEYECFFFAADWHALTTHYENTENIRQNVFEMVVDWLAAGINPGSASIFVQSHVPAHAELSLLLGMMTPLGWLERVPTYKDQQEKLKEKDLATYGFLGYPVLQSADILIYRAGLVPVGEDQVSHIELTRELARRFNHLYGRSPGFEQEVQEAITKMGKKNAQLFLELRKKYLEQGEKPSLEIAQALIDSQSNLNSEARELFFGYLEGGGKIILPEPEAMLTPSSKLLGLDGQKMSKSYNNTITLRDEPQVIEQKIRTMPTDPARVRRTDPGEPTKCPVWNLHQSYSNDETKDWVLNGCRQASIGCLDCKKPVIASIEAEIAPIRERARELSSKPSMVKNVLAEGAERAREVANETMEEVRAAMSLDY